MKKLHPRFEVDENSDEDILIYSTARDEAGDQEPDAPEDDGPVDPRWDILKKLNNN
jgi:hypothetical protein